MRGRFRRGNRPSSPLKCSPCLTSSKRATVCGSRSPSRIRKVAARALRPSRCCGEGTPPRTSSCRSLHPPQQGRNVRLVLEGQQAPPQSERLIRCERFCAMRGALRELREQEFIAQGPRRITEGAVHLVCECLSGVQPHQELAACGVGPSPIR